MTSLRLAIACGVLALSAPAFAQDAPSAPGGTGGLSGWPGAIADRPWNLNGGMLEVHGSMPIFAASSGGGGSSDTLVLAGGGLSVGVSDQLEVGGDYAFELSPSSDAAGVFAGHAMLRLVHDSQLDIALGGAAFYSHAADGFAIAAGAAIRYRLSRQLSIYTGTGGVPICGTCLQILGPVTGQALFLVPNSGDAEILLNVPVGLGFQASPNLYIFADTSIATLELSPRSDSVAEFSDYIGLHAGAWITASNKLEIGGSFADDLKHAGDLYIVEIAAKVFL